MPGSLARGHDPLHAISDNGEGQVTERRTEAVRDRSGVAGRNDLASLKGAEGVVRRFRHCSHHADPPRDLPDRDGGAAQQASAADRGDDDVQIGMFLQELECSSALSRDDAVVVVRVNAARTVRRLVGGPRRAQCNT